MSKKDNRPKTLSEAYDKGRREGRNIFLSVGVGLALLVGVGGGVAGYYIGQSVFENTITLSNGQVYKLDEYDLKILQAYELIKNDWLFGEDVDNLEEVITDNMINGQLDNDDDPYTFYTSDMASQGLSTDGKGLGIVSQTYYGDAYVDDVYDGPAKEAGLLPGDVIESVTIGDDTYTGFDGYSSGIAALATYETSNPNDQKPVTLHVLRGEKNLDLGPMYRGTYSEPIAYAMYDRFDDDVSGNNLITQGYGTSTDSLVIKVNTFLEDSDGQGPEEYVESLIDQALEENGGKIDRLVLDLRGNGGGYVDQGVGLAMLFVPKGTVIEEEINKDDEVVSKYVQTDDPEFGPDEIPDIRLIIDGGSASATEMFTLAMLGSDRATAYGFNSYGKGIAQTFFTFSDGSVIRYTYAKVYGPNPDPEIYGEGDLISIHGVGITPDYEYGSDYSLFDDYSLYDFGYIIERYYIDKTAFTSGDAQAEYQDFFTSILPLLHNSDHDPSTSDPLYGDVPDDYEDALAYYKAANGISEDGFGDETETEFNGELHDLGIEVANNLLEVAQGGQADF